MSARNLLQLLTLSSVFLCSQCVAGDVLADEASAQEKSVQGKNAETLANAMYEYKARMGELSSGRSQSTVVLDANIRLFKAQHAAGESDAAIDYDKRAAEIEAATIVNLANGTGTHQEVSMAKAARINAVLSRCLKVSR